MFLLVALVTLLAYVGYQYTQNKSVEQKKVAADKSDAGKQASTIYPVGSIDIMALNAYHDPYRPTLDCESAFMHVDEARSRGECGIHCLENIRQNIVDKMSERAGYWVEVRNRDGNVLPVPFNRKTILMQPDGVAI